MSPVSRWRRVFVDTRPFRESPPFRRLWIGSTLSGMGSQLTTFAVALQLYTITHSSFAVGLVGLCAAVPSITFGLLGGSVADAVDRRRLVLVVSVGLALVSSSLAAQAFAGLREPWLLYLLVATASLLGTINQPARRTFLPRLLRSELLPAGTALNMLTFHASMTVGPALAGLIVGAWGLRACYLIDAISFGASLYSVFRLPPMPPDGKAARPGLAATAEGLRFIARTKVLIGVFVADLNATVLGMPIALFPALNAARFGGSPRTLGLLTSALAIGGIVGSTLSGPLSRMSRHGRTMLIAVCVWGIGLTGFGLAHSLWLALLMLGIAGVADVLSVISRSTIVQYVTPDRYRGRVNAADFVVGGVAPQLGNFRAGAIGSLAGPGVSAVGGGLAVLVGAALIRVTVPALTGYDSSRTPPVGSEAAPERTEAAAAEA